MRVFGMIRLCGDNPRFGAGHYRSRSRTTRRHRRGWVATTRPNGSRARFVLLAAAVLLAPACRCTNAARAGARAHGGNAGVLIVVGKASADVIDDVNNARGVEHHSEFIDNPDRRAA